MVLWTVIISFRHNCKILLYYYTVNSLCHSLCIKRPWLQLSPTCFLPPFETAATVNCFFWQFLLEVSFLALWWSQRWVVKILPLFVICTKCIHQQNRELYSVHGELCSTFVIPPQIKAESLHFIHKMIASFKTYCCGVQRTFILNKLSMHDKIVLTLVLLICREAFMFFWCLTTMPAVGWHSCFLPVFSPSVLDGSMVSFLLKLVKCQVSIGC